MRALPPTSNCDPEILRGSGGAVLFPEHPGRAPEISPPRGATATMPPPWSVDKKGAPTVTPTIRPSSPGLRRWTVVLSCCMLVLVLHTQTAYGAAGDKVAEIFPADSPGGVSVAFDGQFLYYTNFDGLILHRIAPDGNPLTHTD